MIRRVALACAAYFLCSWTARAQINPEYRLPVAVSLGSVEAIPSPNGEAANQPAGPAINLEIPAVRPGSASLAAEPSPYIPPSPPEPPQGVSGVYPRYEWQASAGYTFVRFYEVPGSSQNLNGGYASVVYYAKDWIGAEAEIFVAFGTFSAVNSHLLMGAGGVRARHQLSRPVEVWAHALAGGSNLTPQTVYGSTHSFSFEAGAGVDIKGRRRWSYRIEGDAVGTLYFNTYQISPKVAAGIVYNF